MLKHKFISRLDGLSHFEDTFGGAMIELGYKNPIGRQVTGSKVFQKLTSKAVDFWMSSSFSKTKVKDFVNNYGIKMSDFKVPADGFKSFNDFFIRQLNEGVREFPPENMGAPAEGRLSVFSLKDLSTELYFKGVKQNIAQLLGGDEELAKNFIGGWAFVFRLCPVDYHRFHFCATGPVNKASRVSGKLHSVNPVSLSFHPSAFVENERQVTIQDSHKFGKLAYVEVGALCVGKIVQTYSPAVEAQVGDEKGYFEFGGSTQILLTTSTVEPSKDLQDNTRNGLETLVQLGNEIASLSEKKAED